MRKIVPFLALVVLAFAVWFGARAFVHRGEIKATIVFDHPGDIRRGDPVLTNGHVIGRVVRVDAVDERMAVTIRLDRNARRDLVSDSLCAVDGHAVVVTNTFAVGAPVEDGAIIHAKQDRVSRWLAKHGATVAPYVDAARASADRLIDDDFSKWNDEIPEWKKQGRAVFDEHMRSVKKEADDMANDLRTRQKVDEAKKLKERFDKWFHEVTR